MDTPERFVVDAAYLRRETREAVRVFFSPLVAAVRTVAANSAPASNEARLVMRETVAPEDWTPPEAPEGQEAITRLLEELARSGLDDRDDDPAVAADS